MSLTRAGRYLRTGAQAGGSPGRGTGTALPRRGLRAGSGTAVGSQSFPEMWTRQPLPNPPPPPPAPCPPGVSLSTKHNPPLCLQGVSPHRPPFPAAPPAPRPPGPRALNMKAPSRTPCENMAPEGLGPQGQRPGALEADPSGGCTPPPRQGPLEGRAFSRLELELGPPPSAPRPLRAAANTRTGGLPSGRVPRAGGRGRRAGMRSARRWKRQPPRVGGAAEPRRGHRAVEGYPGRGRNYFQEAVTCVPSWGTFQIPTPL